MQSAPPFSRLRRRHLLALGLGTAAALTIGRAHAQEQRWEMPTPFPDSNFHTQTVRWFVDALVARSKGQVAITVDSGASRYKMPEIKRAVQTGQVALGEFLLNSQGGESPLLGLDAVPFLARDYDQAAALYQAQKPSLERLLLNQNLRLLYSVPWPPVGILSSVALPDPDAFQGIRIRANSITQRRVVNLMDAMPVTIPPAELPQAFLTRAVGAAILSPLAAADIRAWEFAAHFYDFGFYLPRNAVVIQDKLFRRLDEGMQDLILALAAQAEDRGWAASRRAGADALALLGSHGVRIGMTGPALENRFRQIGDILLSGWELRAGDEGEPILKALR